MIENTTGILDIAHSLELDEVTYLEVKTESIARLCMSRVTLVSRYAKRYRDRRYACKTLLAVETPSKTQLLLRIQRIA